MMRLAITAGEPAGIGADLAVMIAQQDWPCELVVLADPSLLHERASALNLPLTLRDYQAELPPQPQAAGSLTVLPIALSAPVVAGQLNVVNSRYVLEMLARAADGAMSGEFAAIVTAPIHKGIINEAGVPFSGHTEFFAEAAGNVEVVMMLANPGLRVALATTHLPLREVADAITRAKLESVLRILQRELQQKWGIKQPRILVAGLNPHAGEGGHLGSEELTIINPLLEQLRLEGMDLVGALPADTLFNEKTLASADAVLAMYHDQGLPVLKYRGFGRSVNITLGLPFIRTSVDHGTALDLAATGRADCGSLICAINEAITMVESQQ